MSMLWMIINIRVTSYKLIFVAALKIKKCWW